ncbi:unnamed protein product, partial [Mesorhabditis belari]|uniref:DUF155 domain-containing protein n=1 Tax=Mesorhabditis belari TaxID=2138241 RepID=A0AAF3J1H7_9BILA
MSLRSLSRLSSLFPTTSRFFRARSFGDHILHTRATTSVTRYQPLSLAHEEKLKEVAASKLRPKQRKRRATSVAQADRDRLPKVVAIPLAETIDLKALLRSRGFLSLYKASYVYKEFDDVLHLMKKEEYSVHKNDRESEFYIFEEGVIVFWNVSIEDRVQLLRGLEEFMVDPYESSIAGQEQDSMPYGFTEEPMSKIKFDCFVLSEDLHKALDKGNEAVLQRLAFSHALAASVKVGVWEELLNLLAETQADVIKELKRGKITWGRQEALKRAGQFADLRNVINIECNLLNEDLYWERDDLQKFYKMTYQHLALDRRITSLNKRLDYCEELVKMVDNNLAHRHASHLEWMIIVLIIIEVFFDCFHYFDSSPKKVEIVDNTKPVEAPTI